MSHDWILIIRQNTVPFNIFNISHKLYRIFHPRLANMEKARARMTNDLDELAMEYERVNNTCTV